MAASKKRRYQARETGTSRGAIRRVLKNLRSRRILFRACVGFKTTAVRTGAADIPCARTGVADVPVCQGSKSPSTPSNKPLRGFANGDVCDSDPLREIRVIRGQNPTPPQRQNPLCASAPPHLCVEKEARHA